MRVSDFEIGVRVELSGEYGITISFEEACQIFPQHKLWVNDNFVWIKFDSPSSYFETNNVVGFRSYFLESINVLGTATGCSDKNSRNNDGRIFCFSFHVGLKMK